MKEGEPHNGREGWGFSRVVGKGEHRAWERKREREEQKKCESILLHRKKERLGWIGQ